MNSSSKKALIVVAVVLVLLAICFGCFFEVKMETIEERLEDSYFDTTLVENVYMKNLQALPEKEKFNIFTANVIFAAYGLENFDNVKSVLYAYKRAPGTFVAVEFKTEKEAKDFFKELKDNWNIKTPQSIDDYTYGKAGNIVYIGDVSAVRSAFEFPRTLFIREK